MLMSGPNTMQIDPSQKQAPSTETFDARQMGFAAKEDVNLLIEKSKSEIRAGAHENLQILSSFTVTAKPGHEADTYEIYRKEVCNANRLLIKEDANFDIRLEEATPGKFYVVSGRYEETGTVVSRAESTTKPAEGTSIILSEEDRKNLVVSPEKLATMEPDALTDEQWKVMLGLFEQAAKDTGEGAKAFKDLFPSEKIEIVRKIISPTSAEGKEIGFVYDKKTGAEKQDIKKAAETLSAMSGDCDDLALLYIACIKRLEADNLLKVEGIKLAAAGYYDPEENGIMGHANVLHITMESNDKKDLRTTTYLVDLTYNASSTNLKLESDAITMDNADFETKYLAHLNTDKRAKDKINSELIELKLYGGYEGAQAYYYETKGAYLYTDLNNLVTEAAKLRKDGQFVEAEKKCADLEVQLKALYEMMSETVSLGKESGSDYGKALVDFADVCHLRSTNLVNQGSALANLANDEKDLDVQKTLRDQASIDTQMGTDLLAEYLESYKEAIDLPNPDSYTLHSVAKYLRYSSDANDLPKAESKIIEAIEKSRFTPELYETYWDIMTKEGKTDEAKTALSAYRSKLVELGVKVNTEKNDAISTINGLIGE